MKRLAVVSNQKKIASRLFWVSALLLAGSALLELSLPALPDRVQKKNGSIVLATGHAALWNIPDRPEFIRLDMLPALVKKGVVFQEDQAFYEHRGYHLREMRRALAEFVRGGKLRGASTITQQLARTLFLNRSRTFLRKMEELFLARLLEKNLTKDHILELYLNSVYWGKNRYGIRAAALYYFAKEPEKLVAEEIAFLISLLPNPDSCASAKCKIPRVKKRMERLLKYFASMPANNA
jgi:penicillin-binding protein 1A